MCDTLLCVCIGVCMWYVYVAYTYGVGAVAEVLKKVAWAQEHNVTMDIVTQVFLSCSLSLLLSLSLALSLSISGNTRYY